MPAIVHPDIIRWLVRHLAWLAALICHAAHVGPVPLHRGPNVSPLRAHQWFPSMQRRLSGQRGHREWHTVALCFSDNLKIYLPPWNHHESLNNHDNNNTKHVLLSLQELCAQVSDHTSVTETLYFLFPHLLLKQSASGQINAEPITAGQHANTSLQHAHRTPHSNMLSAWSSFAQWKPLKKRKNGGRCYLYISLWRSHRLAHSPAPLPAADLGQTWA